MNAVSVIARTLLVENGFDPEADDLPVDVRGEAARLGQEILFQLGKSGVRLVEPGDVLHETAHVDEGTVSVLLRAG